MTSAQPALQPWRALIQSVARLLALFLALAFAVSSVAAQNKPQPHAKAEPKSAQADTSVPPWLEKFAKDPEMQAAITHLIARLQSDVRYPAPRNSSSILPLIPESTVTYISFPNFGDGLHQAMAVFLNEVQDSKPLRDWYHSGDMVTAGPKIEQVVQQLYEFTRYLGDEGVVAMSGDLTHPNFVAIAEIKKPGLKKFLEDTLKDSSGKPLPDVRILDPQSLAALGDTPAGKDMLALVRSDFLVVGTDAASLRSFSAQLDRKGHEFAASAFGQRIKQAYSGGITTVGAVDLQKIIKQMPVKSQDDRAMFERTGLADAKYLVWQQRAMGLQALADMELSFNGPRKGIAAWLAPPAPLGSLDFVSPKAIVVFSLLLSDPAKIFDDIRDIAGPSKAATFASIPQFEQAMNVSLKDDILSQLSEITLEVPSAGAPVPAFAAILKLKDSARFEETLGKLLVTAPITVAPSDQGGFHSYNVTPQGKTTQSTAYAFIDGYWLIASTQEALAEAVRLHRSGESLAKSKQFLASLPPGHTGMSALVYEDFAALMKFSLAQTMPQMAAYLQTVTGSAPVLFTGYAEQSAIRGTSAGGGMNSATVLMIAAVAIPNLLRSRIAANEASAVGSLRTLNTAEISYSATYPRRGFAPDMTTLGPDPSDLTKTSSAHASLVDASLAGASCTSGAWCVKSGYRFSITAVCQQRMCHEYVATVTPVAANAGNRSYCSTSDGLVRVKSGEPLPSPISVKECQSWAPLQ